MSLSDAQTSDIFQPGGHLRQDLFDADTAVALRAAQHFARETRWDSVRSPHVFMGLLTAPDGGIRNWGERLGADLPRLLAQFRELFHQEEGDRGHVSLHREFLSDNVIRVLREAHQRARDHRRANVTPMDLLITLFTAPQSIVAECFERIGVTAAKLTELAVIAEQTAKSTL